MSFLTDPKSKQGFFSLSVVLNENPMCSVETTPLIRPHQSISSSGRWLLFYLCLITKVFNCTFLIFGIASVNLYNSKTNFFFLLFLHHLQRIKKRLNSNYTTRQSRNVIAERIKFGRDVRVQPSIIAFSDMQLSGLVFGTKTPAMPYW